MKTSKTTSLAALILALAPIANGTTMSTNEINKVRSVLKGLGYPEESIDNNEIIRLQSEGQSLRDFSESVENYKKQIVNNQSRATCGRGTYGCSK